MAPGWSRQSATALFLVALFGGAGALVAGSLSPTGEPSRTAVLGSTEIAAPAGDGREQATADHPSRFAVTQPPAPASLDGPLAEQRGDPGAVAAPSAADPLIGSEPAVPAPAEGTDVATAGEEALTGDELVARALVQIRYPWRNVLPGWQVVFLPGRSGVRGMTFAREKRIEVYVRDADTAEVLARVVAHELGHALDVQHNDTADRARWRAARGADGAVVWWPGDGAEDLATLAGDFAEAFAVWQLGVRGRSLVSGEPTGEQLAVLAAILP